MAVDTNGSPCLQLGIEVFPDCFGLSTERVADKIQAWLGCIV